MRRAEMDVLELLTSGLPVARVSRAVMLFATAEVRRSKFRVSNRSAEFSRYFVRQKSVPSSGSCGARENFPNFIDVTVIKLIDRTLEMLKKVGTRAERVRRADNFDEFNIQRREREKLLFSFQFLRFR